VRPTLLKIYGRPNSSNVAKVMWAVAELGLEHERVLVGGPFGGTSSAEYRALNTTGRIPTSVEDDGFSR
jgi:glutathione S-transferase